MPRFPLTMVAGLVLILAACAPVSTSGGPAPVPPAPVPVPTRSLPQTLRLGQEANGRMVNLRVGDTLELSLPGNPSTGFSWSPNLPLGSVMEQLGPPGFTPSSGGLGASGAVILRYRAVAPGQVLLSLTYGRPFEALPPNPQTFDLFLFVQ